MWSTMHAKKAVDESLWNIKEDAFKNSLESWDYINALQSLLCRIMMDADAWESRMAHVSNVSVIGGKFVHNEVFYLKLWLGDGTFIVFCSGSRQNVQPSIQMKIQIS